MKVEGFIIYNSHSRTWLNYKGVGEFYLHHSSAEEVCQCARTTIKPGLGFDPSKFCVVPATIELTVE